MRLPRRKLLITYGARHSRTSCIVATVTNSIRYIDAGPIAALPQSERFGWLAAPSSTIVQPSAVHTGLSADPRGTLDGLFARLVR